MEGKAPLIVVGSHADLVKESVEADRKNRSSHKLFRSMYSLILLL